MKLKHLICMAAVAAVLASCGSKGFRTEELGVKVSAEENREYLYENWTVTSFTLGPNSATIIGCPVFSTPDEQLTVYMKDGSSVLLYGKATGNGASQLTASATIDLAQVDYILLMDGTKLYVPETK